MTDPQSGTEPDAPHVVESRRRGVTERRIVRTMAWLAGLPLLLALVLTVEGAHAGGGRCWVGAGALALVSAAVVVAAVALGRRAKDAAERLQSLVDIADQLSQGREAAACSVVTGDDEVSVLTRRMCQMASAIAARDGQIREYAQRLESAVADRTRELERQTGRLRYVAAENYSRAQALALANEKAHAATKAKSQFVNNMSHELRTPLNGIVGLADALSRGSVTEGQRELIEQLSGCADSLRLIVDDILDYSQIQDGRVAIRESILDLPRAIRNAVAAVQPAMRKPGVEVTYEVAANCPTRVTVDEIHLSKIMVQLVSNAMKFTARGSVKVRAEVRSAGGHAQLVCTVQDTGCGIPLDRHESIFEAFTQVDGSPSRRHGGTGLGLAISRRLADLMGGTLTVESTVGEGSTFTLSLPVGLPQALDATGESATIAAARSARDPLVVDGRPLRVLVIDDNPVNRLVATKLLQNLGCEVVQAENGALGVEKWSSENLDVVLMDCQMPVMDGYEATRTIRQREQLGRRHTPIVAVTANAQETDRDTCLAAGMDDYLAKPFKAEDLVSRIRAACEPDAVVKER